MATVGRKISGGSTSAALLLAMALFTHPLSAQKSSLAVTGGTITFPAPTAADYIAGFVNSTTGVTFTIDAQTGSSRTTTVSIRSTSASLGGTKVIGDLQWRRSDLATWNSITLTDAQIEQRIVVRNASNDPWSNTIFFRMILNWTTDAPGTYSASYQITLAQTVP
ncbi:MAG: hypothetical protein DMD30_06560 [Gemmatimonadetes bacterium]|nr:MAG: hypothetical protein DMD30_06560 [Gemmatimonadota bacterium]PYP50458.1 MAG: hypothetical protein DMD39_10340 [Gemmatimonadota bacterium]